jgi:hypothetical protein
MAGAHNRVWGVARSRMPGGVWPIAMGVGAIFAAFPSLTTTAQVTVGVVGVGTFVAAARRGRTDVSARLPAHLMLPWIGLGLALCLWELAMRLVGNDDAWPTLSTLMGPIADTNPLGRFVLGAAWTTAGSFLVRLLP